MKETTAEAGDLDKPVFILLKSTPTMFVSISFHKGVLQRSYNVKMGQRNSHISGVKNKAIINSHSLILVLGRLFDSSVRRIMRIII